MGYNDGSTEIVREVPKAPPKQIGVKVSGGGGGHLTLHLRTQSSGDRYNPWIGLAVTGEENIDPTAGAKVRMHIKAEVFEQFLVNALDFVRACKRAEVEEVSI